MRAQNAVQKPHEFAKKRWPSRLEWSFPCHTSHLRGVNKREIQSVLSSKAVLSGWIASDPLLDFGRER